MEPPAQIIKFTNRNIYVYDSDISIQCTMSDNSYNRRNVLKYIGGSAAATQLISGTAAGHRGSSGPIQSRELRGRKRGQLLKEANTSDAVDFVAEELGKRPGVSSVVEYSGKSSGAAVIYRDEKDDCIIQYHQGTTDEPKAFGSLRVDDGVRIVDSEFNTVTDIRTSKASRRVRELLDSPQATTASQNSEKGHSTGKGVLIQDREQELDGAFVPIEGDGEESDLLRIEEQPSGEVVSILDSEFDRFSTQHGGVSIQGHVVCDPILNWICTDYCAVLCGSLALGAFGVCTGTCATTIVGIPISVDCGALCGVAVGGVCYPSCVNQAH